MEKQTKSIFITTHFIFFHWKPVKMRKGNQFIQIYKICKPDYTLSSVYRKKCTFYYFITVCQTLPAIG